MFGHAVRAAARMGELATGAAGVVAERLSSSARRVSRAVGREIAEGFREGSPQLASSMRKIGTELGDSVTSAALDRVSAHSSGEPQGPRSDEASPRPPLGHLAHDLGQATADGAMDGIRSRIKVWSVVAPFAAGLLAAFALKKAIARSGRSRPRAG